MTERSLSEILEAQEHLSLARFKTLSAESAEIPPSRPEGSLIGLMNWAKDNFVQFLTDRKDLSLFVHSRIVVDGAFFTFCEGRGITIESLYKEAIISWGTEYGYERFLAQGVFRIYKPKLEFLVSSLLHEGNEDEISFFVIVSSKNYESYLKLRNSFDEFLSRREMEVMKEKSSLSGKPINIDRYVKERG